MSRCPAVVAGCLLIGLVGCRSDEPPPPTEGEIRVLTYNVAGLPEGLSSSQPALFIPQISPLLDRFDLVLVQEDFWYHDALLESVNHPFVSDPSRVDPDLTDMGDGLNRMSVLPFGMLVREPWPGCWGTLDCASDCLASKGFSRARHELAGGVVVDVYNLHAEAGGCAEDIQLRADGMDYLADAIAAHSAGVALIVAGDTNLHGDDPVDLAALDALIDGAGLTDACRELACGEERRIDRILYRSSAAVTLTPLQWEIPPEFVTADGTPLSDHDPVAVRFRWER